MKLKKVFLLIFSLVFIISCVDKYQLTEPTPTGKLIISSEPDGAKILLLGTDTKKVTPDSLTGLETGKYEITLQKQGFVDTTFSAEVFNGKKTSQNIVLRKVKYKGSIVINSQPQNAQIFLNNLSTGKYTPDSLTGLSPGNYLITLKHLNYADTNFVVTLGENERLNKNIILRQLQNVGSVIISSNPAGAQIFLDGSFTGKFTKDTLTNIIAGNHQITLVKSNYADTTFNIKVETGITTSLTIDLTPITPEGNLFIDSAPQGASIWIDGEPTNLVTPDTLRDLTEGDYQIKLALNGYNDSTFTAHVIKNETSAYFIQLQLAPPTGSIFVDSDPMGAQIYLNGNLINAQTPFTIDSVLTGDNSIKLSLDGFADSTVIVNVQENLTTNVFVFLRDTTSAVDANADYTERADGQIVFSFLFNQSIRLDSVEIRRPSDADIVTLSYFHQLFSEGIPLEIVFPNKIVGLWTFSFFGNKEKGRKVEFKISKFVNVQ